jgi:hypothetical protein
MNIKYKYSAAVIFYVLQGLSLFAQTMVSLPYTPLQLSTDRYDNLFVSDTKGNVHKFSADWNEKLTYSATKNIKVTHLEAYNTLNIFLFYEDYQEIVLLNRFMTETVRQPISEGGSIFARLATYASDNNIWLFCDTDFSLKKLNLKTQQVLFSVPLDLQLNVANYQMNYIKEYQNYLYINDKNSGIYVFDAMGNFFKKMSIPGIQHFTFYANKMWYIQNNQIFEYALYEEKNEPILLPKSFEKIQSIAVTSSFVYAIVNNNQLIYWKKE